jgi:hypothetical protein
MSISTWTHRQGPQYSTPCPFLPEHIVRVHTILQVGHKLCVRMISSHSFHIISQEQSSIGCMKLLDICNRVRSTVLFTTWNLFPCVKAITLPSLSIHSAFCRNGIHFFWCISVFVHIWEQWGATKLTWNVFGPCKWPRMERSRYTVKLKKSGMRHAGHKNQKSGMRNAGHKNQRRATGRQGLKTMCSYNSCEPPQQGMTSTGSPFIEPEVLPSCICD